MSDSLFYQGEGKRLLSKYEEVFKPVDNRSGEDIASEIIEKAGLSLS